MRSTRFAIGVLIWTAVLLSGCRQDTVVAKHEPAKVEATEIEGIKSVTLDERAAERIGLETATVTEEAVTLKGSAATRKVIPYGALMYDTKGDTWAFTSPSPLVFVRQPIVVEDVVGDRVILSEGPPAGTVVVTVGAAVLLGAEHGHN